MRGLYALIDTDALAPRGLDPVQFCAAILRARPAAVQLRDKRGGARRTLALLRAMAPLAQAAEVPLFGNDRPDLALLGGATGVHVGQDDVPPAMVGAMAADRLQIGLSTHDEAQVREALGEPIDVLALGPLFPTAHKERPERALGWETLGTLAALVREKRPELVLVAIGGLGLEVAPRVAELVDLGAVIGALLPSDAADPRWPDDVTERAWALHRAFGGASK